MTLKSPVVRLSVPGSLRHLVRHRIESARIPVSCLPGRARVIKRANLARGLLTCLLVGGTGWVGNLTAAENPLTHQIPPSATALGLPQGGKVEVQLAVPDEVTDLTVAVYDSDSELVDRFPKPERRSAGRISFPWDGRDKNGKPVPDGAYTFVAEGKDGLPLNPPDVADGEAGDIRDAKFDRESGTVVYTLPAPARVLVRLGIQGGPMLKTLVDWEPRVAGNITESWDGRDEDKVMNLWGARGFNVLITYVTLPGATVITYGNTNETYREYKLGRGKDRPKRPDRPRAEGTNQVVRPAGLLPPAWARAPKVLVSLPALSSSTNLVPQVSGTTAVRIDVDPSDKDYVLRDQFEIIFYVDNVFFAEAERGYLPYNFRWETESLPEGEHVLTVNISSFRGQVGVASRKVRVARSKP